MRLETKTVLVCTIVATVVSSYVVGMHYGKNTAPEPCIANYHSHQSPWFARMEQEFIENTDPYLEGSDFANSGYVNPSEMMKSILENTETAVFLSEINGKEYVVPAMCEVLRVNIFGEPILIRSR